LCEGLSGEILPVLRQRGCQYDLIFVDGGHDYEAVSGDWRLCQDLVAPGGVVVFDDFPNWGVAGAVAEIDRRRWSVRLLDHVDIFENHRRDECPAARRMHLLVEVTARAAE
jgi:predicted O-methyltransferase YrrM